MQTTNSKHRRRLAGNADQSVVTVGLVTFAVLQLALGLFMAISPHAFYKQVGPFGAFNSHYVRDVATFYLAIGVGLALAVRWRSWRVPVLALTTVQYTLHSLNHLLDIGKAHSAWTGYFDFFSIAAASALLMWLLYVALNDRSYAERNMTPEVQG